MAPIRRYLRITKNSILEVRIYLDKPSDTPWLLSTREPVLERIITAIRPKVLPKLREENENARKKSGGGKKKKGIKDVVSEEGFEVVIFLKEVSSRHSVLMKEKRFVEKERLRSTGGALAGWLGGGGDTVVVDGDEEEVGGEVLREEGEDDDDVVMLHDIPEAKDGDTLFVSSDEEDDASVPIEDRPSKRQKRTTNGSAMQRDDKKKMALNTAYEGFSIYGRTLCLVVKRKGKKANADGPNVIGGSEMMEHWVSTQAAQEAGLDEDDDG